MRTTSISTTTRTAAATAAALTTATLALSGWTAPASAHLAQEAGSSAASETHRERGVVLECTGTGGGHAAYVSLYENQRYGNVVQVVLDDDPELAGHREPADIKRGRTVATSVAIDGHRARIEGTARPVGRTTRVQESYDDAGQHIEVEGTHQRLRTRLTLTYRGATVPLTCDPAFAYRLRVTTTDTV